MTPMSRDPLDFAMGFVSVSEKWKQQFLPRWQEVLQNFIVEPYESSGRDTVNPYRTPRSSYGLRDHIILKDPQTHQAIMTYASKLTKTMLGASDRKFVQAVPTGYEDAVAKAPTSTKLMRYAFGIPGHFRTMVEAVIDMLLFGTSIIEVGWKFEERDMDVRIVQSDLGLDSEYVSRQRVTTYDDVVLTVIDPVDFFPDPSEYRIECMTGAAKKFKMTAMRAMALARNGVYDMDEVKKAVEARGDGKDQLTDDRWRADQPQQEASFSQFNELVGYEYMGDVPWEDDQGAARRTITVLNGFVVRDRPYQFSDPYLPWKTLIINPVNGRFYGISPAEVIRFDQDFADALKMLIAEAVVRSVHPPIAYDADSDFDMAKLRRWRADLPIGIRGGINSIGTLQYNANFGAAFNMLMGLNSSMQNASGALGSLQGQEGPDREAATVGAMRYQQAMDRPELAAMVLEQECLPPLAQSILRRYQQFLLDSDDLRRRVGEQPEPASLADIMGEFDIQFVGSRSAMSPQQRLQSYQTLAAISSAVPQLRAQIPWGLIGRDIAGEVLQLPEVAARMSDPQEILRNLALQQVIGANPSSNGNSAMPGMEPAGLAPAQAAGGVLNAG